MKIEDYYDGTYRTYYPALAPATVEGYEGAWRNWVEPQWRGWELEDIRVRHINAWLAAGAGEAGYKLLRQIIRSAIADECYREDVTDPTTRGIRHPRRPKAAGEKPALTEREAKALLVGLVGWEYEATVVLGLWLGLRRSEQCGMKWGRHRPQERPCAREARPAARQGGDRRHRRQDPPLGEAPHAAADAEAAAR